MHCEYLSNINGIQIKLFSNIKSLNLSSNNIDDMTELLALRQVSDLNLSCNKITRVAGLDNMLSSLEKINLSHNRVASLQYFGETIKNGLSAPNLESIDLNDNYIGDLSHIKYLKAVTSLKSVVF